MAQRNAIMPGARTPLIDGDGRLNPVWYRFLVDLHERTGGGAEDKVESAESTATTAQSTATTAQTAASAAQTTANTALATASGAESASIENNEEVKEIRFLGNFGTNLF